MGRYLGKLEVWLIMGALFLGSCSKDIQRIEEQPKVEKGYRLCKDPEGFSGKIGKSFYDSRFYCSPLGCREGHDEIGKPHGDAYSCEWEKERIKMKGSIKRYVGEL